MVVVLIVEPVVQTTPLRDLFDHICHCSLFSLGLLKDGIFLERIDLVFKFVSLKSDCRSMLTLLFEVPLEDFSLLLVLIVLPIKVRFVDRALLLVDIR